MNSTPEIDAALIRVQGIIGGEEEGDVKDAIHDLLDLIEVVHPPGHGCAACLNGQALQRFINKARVETRNAATQRRNRAR